VVDSFDGAFQKLGLDSGDHKIELKAEGYEPLQFDVLITPGETVTYKGGMKPLNK
jgi:PEGA domain